MGYLLLIPITKYNYFTATLKTTAVTEGSEGRYNLSKELILHSWKQAN